MKLGYGCAVVMFPAVLSGCLELPEYKRPDAGNDGGSDEEQDGSTVDPSGNPSGGDSGAMVVNPPPGEWRNVTSNLAQMASECGNLSAISAKPDEDLLIAGIARKGLWASSNGGESWSALGDGAGSATILNRASSIIYDPAEPNRFWETGLYNENGVYRTSDNGKVFSALGDARHIDLLSIDFSDPARNVMVAGGHEAPRVLFRSDNGGTTWTDIGAALPGNNSCTWPLVINASTYLVGCSYLGEGIYRSTDSGQSWALVSSKGGSAAPLRASDNSIYWAAANNGGILRSTDDGVTWSPFVGTGVVTSISPVELPDGRIAAVGTNSIVASADEGESWQPVSAELPYRDISGFIYSTHQKAFFIKHFSCDPTPVPMDAIMRFDYDATKR